MKKIIVNYENFEGEQVQEELMFNLNKTELAELNGMYEGGLEAHMARLKESNNTVQILAFVKSIAVKAYGIKSPSGKAFIKPDDVVMEFMYSDALSELTFDLMTDSTGKKMEDFMLGLFPTALQKQIQEHVKK